MLQQIWKTYYEAFELWQKAADHVWEEWARQPAVVEAMSRNLSTMLDLREAWNRLGTNTGLAPSDDFLREFAYMGAGFMKVAANGFVRATGRDILPRLAETPCDEVYTEGKARLLRYRTRERLHKTPLLIVCSLVNRYYILDLTPGRSLVEYLSECGYDVYIIDWGSVTAQEHWYDFEYYNGLLERCACRVLELSETEQLSLLGYCIGGLLSTIYTAFHPEQVRNLALMATPIDFKDAGLVSTWADEKNFDVDRLIDVCKVAPAELVQTAFVMLKPATNLTKYVNLLKHPNDEAYLRSFLALEIWAHDNVSLPGEFYRKLVKELYQQNRLVQGRLQVGGRRVDLEQIRSSLLVVTGAHDHIVPTRNSVAIFEHVSSQDREHLEFPYGHISMSVSDGAIANFWPRLANWLSKRSSEAKEEAKEKKRRGRKDEVQKHLPPIQ